MVYYIMLNPKHSLNLNRKICGVIFRSLCILLLPGPLTAPQGHLFLVVELLGGNLFDTQCYDPSYFSAARMQSIAKQVLQALAFLHANHVIHADVK